MCRKHVYDDLEPYVCLSPECDLGIHTFKSRSEWTIHEFQTHRIEAKWYCNLCNEVSINQERFRAHLQNAHFQDVGFAQIEDVVSASKRICPRSAALEICPFCATAPAQTQKVFASHVGKHLQEISLAALPNLDEESDEDFSDSSGDDGDGGSKKSSQQSIAPLEDGNLSGDDDDTKSSSSTENNRTVTLHDAAAKVEAESQASPSGPGIDGEQTQALLSVKDLDDEESPKWLHFQRPYSGLFNSPMPSARVNVENSKRPRTLFVVRTSRKSIASHTNSKYGYPYLVYDAGEVSLLWFCLIMCVLLIHISRNLKLLMIRKVKHLEDVKIGYGLLSIEIPSLNLVGYSVRIFTGSLYLTIEPFLYDLQYDLNYSFRITSTRIVLTIFEFFTKRPRTRTIPNA